MHEYNENPKGMSTFDFESIFFLFLNWFNQNVESIDCFISICLWNIIITFILWNWYMYVAYLDHFHPFTLPPYFPYSSPTIQPFVFIIFPLFYFLCFKFLLETIKVYFYKRLDTNIHTCICRHIYSVIR